MKKSLCSVLSALALAAVTIGASVSAQAQRRPPPIPGRPGHGPRPGERMRLSRLAAQMRNEARQVLRIAQREANPRRPVETQVVRLLQTLSVKADRFEQDVRRARGRERQVESSFRQLEQSAFNAERRLWDARFSQRVDQAFQGVARTLADIRREIRNR